MNYCMFVCCAYFINRIFSQHNFAQKLDKFDEEYDGSRLITVLKKYYRLKERKTNKLKVWNINQTFENNAENANLRR